MGWQVLKHSVSQGLPGAKEPDLNSHWLGEGRPGLRGKDLNSIGVPSPILFSAFLGVDFFLSAYRQLSSHSSGRGSPPHWSPSQKTLTKEERVLLLGPAQNIPGWDTLGWQVPLYTNHWSQEASCVSLNSVSFTFLMYKIEIVLTPTRNSLLVQWLTLCASNTGDMGSLSGQGTKIPHTMWSSQKKKLTLATDGYCED